MAQKWSKDEDKLLKENYIKYSYGELVEKFFPNRTIPSIRGRIIALGLKSKIFKWNEDDIALLKEKYENGMYIKDIQRKYFPNLSVEQIQSKTSVLHLKHLVSCEWSEEEDVLLKENFANYTNLELHNLFFAR